MSKRPIIFILLAASLSLPVLAQKPITLRKAPITAEDIAAVDEDPKLAGQRERLDREMNRELFQMRESLMREAVNKMNSRRYDQGGFSGYERVMGNFLAFLVFVILLGAVLWLIRTILNNRRWTRVASIQTEIHNKLLEKMASNQELLAYMETEAGKRFLESSPFEVERPSQSPTFPYGRILLSAQAGVVMIMTGVGMLWLQERLPDEAQGLLFFGILLMAPGVGLLVSSFLSYSMSRHFGLMPENQK
jgi:hypothetical protein